MDGTTYVIAVIAVLVALELLSRGRGCLSGIAKMILGLWRIVVIIFIAIAVLQFAGVL